jgi:pimeloyl-ACP methyl ester carboxylesterase
MLIGSGVPRTIQLAAGARRRRDRFPSREAALANYASKPPFSAFDPAVLDAYVQWGFSDEVGGGVRLLCRPEDEASTYENAPSNGVWESLPKVRCGVTLACGGEGAHFGRDAIDAMAARMPHATTEEIPGTGHFGPLELTSVTARALAAALARAPGG